ncbi:hypothetical protein SRABI05_02892 [Agrobacterium fabrum]|nr:hypothetical protein SRABI46_03128 [Agrobacterium fabrum]CAH0247404.1 hypothetical protein SRABI05_02892 [Agrobacterium fabrum]
MARTFDLIYLENLCHARLGRERAETLPRLARMYDDILSGKVHRWAVDAGEEATLLEARWGTPAAVTVYMRLRGVDAPQPLTQPTLRVRSGENERISRRDDR